MALDFLVSSSAGIYGSRCGPYKAAGALYLVLMGTDPDDGSGTGSIEIHKSSDAGETWSVVETIACEAPGLYYGSDFHGTTIYVAYFDGNAALAIFDCNTDAVTSTITSSIAASTAETYPNGNGSGDRVIHCAYRPANDDVVVVYNDSVGDGGTYYDDAETDPALRQIGRVYAVPVTGSFGSPVQIYPAPGVGVQQSWHVEGVTRGTSGRAHIIASQRPGTFPLLVTPRYTLSHRALLGDNTAGTATDIFDDTAFSGDAVLFSAFPVSKADGSTVWATYNSSGDEGVLLCAASADDPTWTSTTITTGLGLQLGVSTAGDGVAVITTQPGGTLSFGLTVPIITADGACGTPVETSITIEDEGGFYWSRGMGGIVYSSRSTTSTTYFFPIADPTEQFITGENGIPSSVIFGQTHGLRGGGQDTCLPSSTPRPCPDTLSTPASPCTQGLSF